MKIEYKKIESVYHKNFHKRMFRAVSVCRNTADGEAFGYETLEVKDMTGFLDTPTHPSIIDVFNKNPLPEWDGDEEPGPVCLPNEEERIISAFCDIVNSYVASQTREQWAAHWRDKIREAGRLKGMPVGLFYEDTAQPPFYSFDEEDVYDVVFLLNQDPGTIAALYPIFKGWALFGMDTYTLEKLTKADEDKGLGLEVWKG